MGEVRFALQPRCPVHGRMRHDEIMSRWVCTGGGGCARVVTDERLSWVALTAVRPWEWREPFTVTARDLPGG